VTIKSKRLNAAVNAFVRDMKKRLAQKEAIGYKGWDSAAKTGCSNASLIADIEEDIKVLDLNISPVTCADIANRCMMLSYRIKKTAIKRK